MKQTTFASLAFDHKKKLTKRERFLREMDQVVPWERLLKLIAPHYPSAGNGRTPMPLETMLRIYFLQQWFNLSDPAAEDSLYDIESMRRFAGIELSQDAVPDETTILNFRRLLERHRLTEAIFRSVNRLLTDRRLLLKSGTLVDATIVSAPSSTKNADRQRDPEMTQTRKGNQWLRTALVEAALGAMRSRDTYLSAHYRRVARRRGHAKAVIAVAHTILVIAHHLISRKTTYQDLGADFFERRDQTAIQRRCIRQLERLGFNVALTPQEKVA